MDDLPASSSSFDPSNLDPNPVHHVNTPTAHHPQNPPNTPVSRPGGPNIPPPVSFTENNKYSAKVDPPLVSVSVTNPITYLKLFINRLLKNEGITIKIKPLTAIAMIIALSTAFGTGFNVARIFFPNSSPILHRTVTLQGTIQKSENGQYYLSLPDNTLWILRSASPNSLTNTANKQALVKGNLTAEANVINVSEIMPFDAPLALQGVPLEPGAQRIPNQDLFPKLYSGLTWEVTQRRVLIFTSGKRKIEQEGIYLESAQVTDYPQAFLDYYNSELQKALFKQTLSASDPNGVTVTYAKDDLYFTFGIKNVSTGSGEKKQITGYKTYIEHN